MLNVRCNIADVPEPRHHEHRGGIALRESEQLVQAGIEQRGQVQSHALGQTIPLPRYDICYKILTFLFGFIID